MRHARPSCDECTRLAAETSALYQALLDAQDALAFTDKNHRQFVERRRALEQLRGQLREARKRDAAHEATHQDEFS